MSYFSDAVSFQLIRNLGGGSLFDAFLFVLNEGALMLIGLGGALILYGIVVVRLRRRGNRTLLPAGRSPLRWAVLALTVAMPVIAAQANGVPDARDGLRRMTAYGLVNRLLEQLTDFDRDGYSWYSAQIDRHPFDASRHPLALDIPGNGIDEDGFGGDFVFTGADPATPAPKLPAKRKHLVVIVLESTRADALTQR